MKLITAIVNKKDAAGVCGALRKEKFFFTKLSTSGGFLGEGNTTLLIGVEDEQVKGVLEVIRLHCQKRMEPMPAIMGAEAGYPAFNYTAAQVLVGGATVFVTNIEHFEKF
ncbi:MAG: cyclic-di-AMP receptor [Bacillota bacterium]|nr:cyclic-di-AMP receptor [Bacillota bacterium]